MATMVTLVLYWSMCLHQSTSAVLEDEDEKTTNMREASLGGIMSK